MRNRLIHEKSPYLLQHAENPVNWFPWGEEAFRTALESDRPVFLSIGYSTCHWCHVMARESFGNTEVAKLMNDAFVCIKVDKEERPDIDSVFMSFCQMMTGSGGWPLTIIMTPDKKPFFAATYIPKESRFGQSGLLDLVPKISSFWKKNRSFLIDNADKMISHLDSIQAKKVGKKKEPDQAILDGTYEELRTRYDTKFGGFGGAPKFPVPHNISFLLRYWKRTGSSDALEMAEKTLQAMHRGGIYDHVGHGFHRYTTDAGWTVPHFEKMLYDQALLSMAYTEAYQATGNTYYEKTTREILSYVTDHLTSSDGGFYCAEDAESEGKEGAFYVWTEEEIRKILNSETADLVIQAFHVKPEGNFAGALTGKEGKNILHSIRSIQDLPQALEMEKHHRDSIEAALRILSENRKKRIPPHLDDKILTDWNGLMIAAFAKASQAFGDPLYLESATKAARFLLKHLCDSQGRLLHRFWRDDSGIQAFLNDYAFLILGLIEIYEAGFDISMLDSALRLNREMITLFEDTLHGGFFLSLRDSAEVPVNQKEIYDGAVPSGNSVVVFNLLRLARLTGDSSLEAKADETINVFLHEIGQSPSSHTYFMEAVDFALGPSKEVVIAGDRNTADTQEMVRKIQAGFTPNTTVLLKTNHDAIDISRLAEFTEKMHSVDGKATAFVCSHHACKKPVTSVNEMMELLRD